MRILKTAIATCSVLVAVLSMAEIASCLLNPDTYGLGTESMMNNGRMYYQSTGSFLFQHHSNFVDLAGDSCHSLFQKAKSDCNKYFSGNYSRLAVVYYMKSEEWMAISSQFVMKSRMKRPSQL